MPSIFITGVSRGIGREFARQYADAGWNVTATCRDPADAAALTKAGVELLALDLNDIASIPLLAERLAGRSFDILLNNAGLYGQRQSFGKIDAAEWEQVFRVNCIAPIKLAEALLPHLLAGQHRQMVFLSTRMASIADNGGGGSIVYRSSKAALNAAVKSLSIDLAPQGVTALLLHPGWVKTDMGGSGAAVEIPDSVAGMRRRIEEIKPGQALKFIDYQGTSLPW